MSSLTAVCLDAPTVSAHGTMAKYVVFVAIWAVLAAWGSLLMREVPDNLRELALLALIGPPVVLVYLAVGELVGGVIHWMRERLPFVRHIDQYVSTRTERQSFSVLRILWGTVVFGGVIALLFALTLMVREHL